MKRNFCLLLMAFYFSLRAKTYTLILFCGKINSKKNTFINVLNNLKNEEMKLNTDCGLDDFVLEVIRNCIKTNGQKPAPVMLKSPVRTILPIGTTAVINSYYSFLNFLREIK
jgi:hypothetical protein